MEHTILDDYLSYHEAYSKKYGENTIVMEVEAFMKYTL